jgi:hypothetical protein
MEISIARQRQYRSTIFGFRSPG